MKRFGSNLLSVAALVASLGALPSAHADWMFNSSATSGIAGSSGAPTVSLSGAYAANGATGTGFASGATWTTATSGTYSAKLNYIPTGIAANPNGFGMSTSSGDSAGLDNLTNTEAVLLSFSSSVVLGSIYVAPCDAATHTCGGTSKNSDVDISLFRYTGTGLPTLSGAAASTMAGWQLVGNYANLQGAPTPDLINSGGLSSSYWLISAYNTSFGSTNSSPGGTLEQGNDCFELYGVGTSSVTTVVPPSVPEPTSLALAGLAIAGVFARRRKFAASRPAA